MKNKLEVKIECDTSGLDAAQVKAGKLVQTFKKPTHWQMNWLY